MNAPAARRPWLAGLLGFLCNGLGHMYAGRLAPAIAIHALWLATGFAAAAAMRVGPRSFVLATGVSFAVWILQAVDAVATARRTALEPRARSSRWPALVGFYVATVVVSNVLVPPFRARVAHTMYAPGGSMIPTIQVGDVFAVASGRPRSLRGAVVEFEAPPGNPRRESLVKRVVAVGGDTVELREGALVVNGTPVPRDAAPGTCAYADRAEDGTWREQPCVHFVEMLDGRAVHTYCTPDVPCGDVARQIVPAGYVWLAGDHRDHSADSRVHGPVPERTIVGEVRWVMLSWGPLGPRWDRFGREVR